MSDPEVEFMQRQARAALQYTKKGGSLLFWLDSKDFTDSQRLKIAVELRLMVLGPDRPADVVN